MRAIGILNMKKNIKEARFKIRSKKYLTEPERATNDITSFDGKKLGKNFKNILSLSKEMRGENILQLIKKNNFRTSFRSQRTYMETTML